MRTHASGQTKNILFPIVRPTEILAFGSIFLVGNHGNGERESYADLADLADLLCFDICVLSTVNARLC